MAEEFPRRLACIDVGSNGIRYAVAEFLGPSSMTILDQSRASVRLGQGTFRNGRIRDEDLHAAVDAIDGFVQRSAAMNIDELRVVATSAVRDAANQDELVQSVAARTGVTVEVIHGAEEARLIHGAIVQAMDLGKGAWLFADLGGGSLEVGMLDKAGMQWGESCDIGTVRLLQKFAKKVKPAKVDRLVAESIDALRLPGSDEPVAGLIATGGNIEALADLVTGSSGRVVSVDALREKADQLAALTVEERIAQGLRPDRADVIVPAAFVYLKVAAITGAKEIHVPRVGLKEGILLDLASSRAGPRRKEAAVRQGALALGRRYHVDEAHVNHVARSALRVFDGTKPLHELDDELRPVLLAAAYLHDVGAYIAHKRHHKHSHYLIQHADLPGLDAHEVRLAALVARYHRRAEPTTAHAEFAVLAKADRKRVEWLAGMLRIADALDADHRQRIQDFTMTWDKKTLAVAIQGEGDLALEEWAFAKKGALLARLAKRRLALQVGTAVAA